MDVPDPLPEPNDPGDGNACRVGFPGSAQTTRRKNGGRSSRSHRNGNGNGPVNRTSKREQRPKFTGAIFVHAGAGFHSRQNEHLHLGACSDAATMGMTFLRAGASATEAVVAALRVLEDKEITNAGYGSNLSIDGTVECDATIVNHLGRSGACGAVPNVRNPICLAKLILDESGRPMTLRRVAPNILVGEGARNFAMEHGMLVVPNENMISRMSRDRFIQWQEDLQRADKRLKLSQMDEAHHSESAPSQISSSVISPRGDHANAILLGTWNEGQPDSPYRGSPSAHEREGERGSSPRLGADLTALKDEQQTRVQVPRGIKRPLPLPEDIPDESPPMDMITDTIGAIAVDAEGNIAAGSSSGGIGMKHRGRLGPAALVGVGTAVVPCDPNDPDGVSVATVTSGTGEHMATTMASQRCAERIYRNTRRGPRGQDVPEEDEDVIMQSFIKDDFMGHPGVRDCTPVAAIGLMTVKKTKGSCYLYFAHNTDSFALASMGGSDKEPQCVMSRVGSVSKVTGGARKVTLE